MQQPAGSSSLRNWDAAASAEHAFAQPLDLASFEPEYNPFPQPYGLDHAAAGAPSIAPQYAPDVRYAPGTYPGSHSPAPPPGYHRDPYPVLQNQRFAPPPQQEHPAQYAPPGEMAQYWANAQPAPMMQAHPQQQQQQQRQSGVSPAPPPPIASRDYVASPTSMHAGYAAGPSHDPAAAADYSFGGRFGETPPHVPQPQPQGPRPGARYYPSDPPAETRPDEPARRTYYLSPADARRVQPPPLQMPPSIPSSVPAGGSKRQRTHAAAAPARPAPYRVPADEHVSDEDDEQSAQPGVPRERGACARCKTLKVKCVRLGDPDAICRRCYNGGHDCYVPGKKQRRQPP
jgi:hypothetical protein